MLLVIIVSLVPFIVQSLNTDGNIVTYYILCRMSPNKSNRIILLSKVIMNSKLNRISLVNNNIGNTCHLSDDI